MSRRDGRETPEDPMAGDDLVSLLYGELEPDEAERTGARVAADPAESARLGDMRRVRELFSSMVDEEPPSRLTAQLMAEAARSAPQQRRVAAPARVGFWARLNSWLQPLVQRPALAAAASLVLVAGVAGVLYMKKGDELTSTAPEPAATGETRAPATTGEAPRPESPPPAVTATPADSTLAAEERADGDDEAAAPSEADPAKPGPAKTVAKRSKRASSSSSAYGDKSLDMADRKRGVKSGTVYGLSEQEMVPKDEAPGGAEGAGGAAGGAAEQKPATSTPPATPEPAPQAPSQKADGKAPARPSVSDLHKRAVDAALDRRCSDVKLLAGQVRAADSAYYANTFAGDKRLQSCLSSPKRSPSKK